MLADQRDNWAMTESVAETSAAGRYRWTLPAGSHRRGHHRSRATTSTSIYLANGFATVDQRKGGLVKSGPSCRSKRVVTMNVRRRVGMRSLVASATRGKVRVRRTARGWAVRLDLRRVGKGTVKVRLTARTRGGRVVQTRAFRTCLR